MDENDVIAVDAAERRCTALSLMWAAEKVADAAERRGVALALMWAAEHVAAVRMRRYTRWVTLGSVFGYMLSHALVYHYAWPRCRLRDTEDMVDWNDLPLGVEGWLEFLEGAREANAELYRQYVEEEIEDNT